MTDPSPVPDDGWPARLDELLAGARRRRAERQRIREEHAAARSAGLKARHAAKLARADPKED